MDGKEETLFELFRTVREDLLGEYGVGLSLKAEGQDFTLRVRSRKNTGDEKQPYFAVVVAPTYGGFRVSYKPSGNPPAENTVTVVDDGSAGRLLGIMRGFVEAERKRLIEFRQR
jgi:hypothetical protein